MDEHETAKLNRPAFDATDFREKKPILAFLKGAQVGRSVLLAEDTITLGRSAEASIMLYDNHVSRIHCRVEYDRKFNVYLVSDLNSSNGTLLNDKTVERAILNEGDKIIIGETVLRFSLVDRIEIAYHGELDRLINIDEVTGLVVKRRFEEELSRHVAVARRDETALSMLMMDMDGLKQINDTHGHAFGAHAVSETGRLIKKILAGRGIASRFGGDEFMVMLPGAAIAPAVEVAQNVCHEVETYRYEKDGVAFRLTITAGAAELRGDETPEELTKRADEALYRAKRAGRNRVST
jgi:two-component system cell cycle response regulator